MGSIAVSVGGRMIGDGHPIYLIAEVGTTSLGDLDKALRLVDAVADAGLDAVKFQVIDPEQISDPSTTYTYRSGGQTFTANMQEMFRRLRFAEEDWRRIAAAAKARGLHFFATEDYLEGVELMERVGVPAHKLGAWDTTYMPLIRKFGATGKPLFVDLGPTSEAEIDALLAAFREAGGRELLLLHDYHTSDDTQMNLRAIAYLDRKLPWPVGYSSPARDDDIDMAAIGLGARFLEKRLILSRSERAFHADESLEPAELKAWAARVRHVERALGVPAVRPSQKDLEDARKYYRSICTLRAIRSGETLGPDNVCGKRPGSGVPTARLDRFWGRRAARDLPANTLLSEADVA